MLYQLHYTNEAICQSETQSRHGQLSWPDNGICVAVFDPRSHSVSLTAGGQWAKAMDQTRLYAKFVCWLVSQQQASVSQGRICSDNLTCCHTEIEVADPTFYLTQSQYLYAKQTVSSAPCVLLSLILSHTTR